MTETGHTTDSSLSPPAWRLAIAFAALYLIWGSTYLAIKVTIETMPPLLMAASRFIVAGSMLYAFARFTGTPKPRPRDWGHAAIVGACLIAGGNGIVSFAEQWIDSSIAALIIASSPLFMTFFGWLGGVQRRPTALSIGSLIVGTGGVSVLALSNGASLHNNEIWGYALVLLAVLSWTGGCIYAKRNPSACDTWLSSSMQMICGSLVCFIASLATGEMSAGIDLETFSLRSWTAFVYLIGFGSIAGYTSYVYLLKHCSPTTVSSHAYVNPVVAVFLGWLILDEHLSIGGWIGSGMIILSVFTLLTQNQAKIKGSSSGN